MPILLALHLEACMAKRNERPQAGVAREDRDASSRDAVEASFIPILKKQGMHVPERIIYDARAGFSPAATGAPSSGKYDGGRLARHREKNQPAGGTAEDKLPFMNLRSGK